MTKTNPRAKTDPATKGRTKKNVACPATLLDVVYHVPVQAGTKKGGGKVLILATMASP